MGSTQHQQSLGFVWELISCYQHSIWYGLQQILVTAVSDGEGNFIHAAEYYSYYNHEGWARLAAKA